MEELIEDEAVKTLVENTVQLVVELDVVTGIDTDSDWELVAVLVELTVARDVAVVPTGELSEVNVGLEGLR